MDSSSLHPQTDDSSQKKDLAERFARLKERVLVKRPVLKSILEKKGNKPLFDYASEYVDVNLNPPIMRRQNELLSTIHEATDERYGQVVADSVMRQLEKHYFVSTADHVGPVVNPFAVNANLLTATASMGHTDPDLQNVIILACANISLNNHTFPRGLLFHTYRNDTLEEHRLSFLPSNSHAASTYTFRPYLPDEVTKIRKVLREKTRDGNVPTDISTRLDAIIDEIYNVKEVFQCASFREQVAMTNMKLWEKFFEKSNAKLPRLVYLEQEDIVVRLLTKYHLNEDTVVNHILFDPKYEPFVSTYFQGIFGSFSEKDQTGTYLFWARPEGGKVNLQLWRKGNKLVSADGSYEVELTPDAIRTAMESRVLIPGLLLNFITICFYYGLKCLGGFNQVNYLTLMKNAYIRMNVDLENYRSIEVCARAQTKEICDGPSFTFLGYGKGEMTLADGLDLILYGQEDSWSRLQTLCREITIDESLNPLMPEMYAVSYDQNELEPDLLSITANDVNQLTGLDKKMQPCISI